MEYKFVFHSFKNRMEIHFFRGEKRRTENPHFTLQTKIMEDFIIDEISYPITVGFNLCVFERESSFRAGNILMKSYA